VGVVVRQKFDGPRHRHLPGPEGDTGEDWCWIIADGHPAKWFFPKLTDAVLAVFAQAGLEARGNLALADVDGLGAGASKLEKRIFRTSPSTATKTIPSSSGLKLLLLLLLLLVLLLVLGLRLKKRARAPPRMKHHRDNLPLGRHAGQVQGIAERQEGITRQNRV